MKSIRRTVSLIIGPLLLAASIWGLPQEIFVESGARAAIGTVAWMAFWWVTAPVDYAVTAFLPIAVNAVIQMADMDTVIANYASETILLLLGASILTVSWEKTGLDRRIAISFLNLIGSNLRRQILSFFPDGKESWPGGDYGKQERVLAKDWYAWFDGARGNYDPAGRIQDVELTVLGAGDTAKRSDGTPYEEDLEELLVRNI